MLFRARCARYCPASPHTRQGVFSNKLMPPQASRWTVGRNLFRNLHSRIFCLGVYQAPIAHQASSDSVRHNQGRKGTDGFHGLRVATGAHSQRPCLNNGLSLGHLHMHMATSDVNGILATDHTRVMRETLELCAGRVPGPHQLWRQLQHAAWPPALAIFELEWAVSEASISGAIFPKCMTPG